MGTPANMVLTVAAIDVVLAGTAVNVVLMVTEVDMVLVGAAAYICGVAVWGVYYTTYQTSKSFN